ERKVWDTPGGWTTAVGYAGGTTPNPTYEEVCSGMTGHTEAVLVVFDPKQTSYEALLKAFWESHDPTQDMRQGNDVGTQYRSGIYVSSPEQRRLAEASRDAYQRGLKDAGYGPITTEILDAPEFYYAEDYHQQYLATNPMGYCGLGGTCVACPTALSARVRPGATGAGAMLPGLTPNQQKYFQAGAEVFTEVSKLQNGLGPRFNLDSCGGCHSQPALGGTSPAVNPQIAVATAYGARNKPPS